MKYALRETVYHCLVFGGHLALVFIRKVLNISLFVFEIIVYCIL